MEKLEFTSNAPQENKGIGVPKILVIGCGGAGNNGVHRLNKLGITGAKTVAVNTDMQALMHTDADMKVLIGKNITHGMGSGGDPKVARRCLESSRIALEKILHGTDLVFIIGGMGGGTATGISGELAKMAQKANAIVIAIVTTPFKIERDKLEKALDGVEELAMHAHSLLVLDNNRLLDLVGSQPVDQAFLVIDHFIAEIIKGITEVITEPSLMNLDFNDVRSILSHGGWSTLLYGEGSDINPTEVVENALNNPIMENIDIKGATGALIHITCGRKMSLGALQEIANRLTDGMDDKANVVLGARIDPSLEGNVRVMSIITGLDDEDPSGQGQGNCRPEAWDKWDIPSVY
jgi:cell division protein FtsZ